MEIRVLRYFLAVAREGSISTAAESLHITQPTLSRQIKDLEDDLGKKLIIRGSKKISLTDEGRLFRKRAQEIVDLVNKTRSEIESDYEGGDIYIGCGETEQMRLIAKAVRDLQKDYPLMRFHLFSGNAIDITERLDRGLLDFGVLVNPSSMIGYDFIRLPCFDKGGLLMCKDNPLAALDAIRPRDLEDVPIITSRSEMSRHAISKWLGRDFDTLNIVGSFNLIFNAALMVEEGVGCAWCLDRLVKIPEDSVLCFRPFEPVVEMEVSVVWKKNQVFSNAAGEFLKRVKAVL